MTVKCVILALSDGHLQHIFVYLFLLLYVFAYMCVFIHVLLLKFCFVLLGYTSFPVGFPQQWLFQTSISTQWIFQNLDFQSLNFHIGLDLQELAFAKLDAPKIDPSVWGFVKDLRPARRQQKIRTYLHACDLHKCIIY